MEQQPAEGQADRGLSVWVLVTVVVLALVLVGLPLWWLLDTYVFADTEGVVGVSTTTTSGGDAVGTPSSSVALVGGPVVNLALYRPVTASGPGSDSPQRLVDGDHDTSWNSGAYAPQVFIVDLGESSAIHSVRLRVGQYPNGETVHELHGWRTGESEPELLHTFEGFTSGRQWLTFTPEAPISDIDRIGVATVSSPSWVAWFEIQVMGTQG